MGYAPITELITEVLKIKERVKKNAKWHKYEEKLICKIGEVNSNSGIQSKGTRSIGNKLTNNVLSGVRHNNIADSTNSYVRSPKSTAQYVEGNDNANVSNNKTVGKPTYASIAKKGIKDIPIS